MHLVPVMILLLLTTGRLASSQPTITNNDNWSKQKILSGQSTGLLEYLPQLLDTLSQRIDRQSEEINRMAAKLNQQNHFMEQINQTIAQDRHVSIECRNELNQKMDQILYLVRQQSQELDQQRQLGNQLNQKLDHQTNLSAQLNRTVDQDRLDANRLRSELKQTINEQLQLTNELDQKIDRLQQSQQHIAVKLNLIEQNQLHNLNASSHRGLEIIRKLNYLDVVPPRLEQLISEFSRNRQDLNNLAALNNGYLAKYNRTAQETICLMENVNFRLRNVEQQVANTRPPVPTIRRCRVCFHESEGSSQCQGNRYSCSGWSDSAGWTASFRDDTDGRAGGCTYQWMLECQ